MSFADDIRRSNSLINYLLTELEQIDVVDEVDAGACGEQLSLWAKYASQQLYFEGHRRQSDCVLNLCDAFSAEDRDSARKINPRSDLVYRIEIYRGILEELLDTSEANKPAPRASRFNKLRDVPEVDDEALSQEPPAAGGGFIPAHDPLQDARGSNLSARKSLLMIALVLAVSAALFFKLFDLKEVAAALSGGGAPPPARNANEPKPPSGIRHQDLGNTDSIFLTKLDNPPEDGRQQKFTMWLAATGNVAYVIDSVTVKKRGGIFYSEVSPGPPWDADYVIDYKGYFEEKHPLEPPLVLNPSEGELSFTLVLRHVTKYGVYCDKVGMEINYIGADGTEGKLYIREPTEEALTLSSLLETDIETRGLITTPQGVQRGIAGNRAAAPKLIYEPVEDILSSAYEPALTPERAALDNAVERKKLTPKIIELIGANNRVAFDLCSTLPDPRCEAALMRAGASVGQMRNALHYMSRRHLLKPSGALADFILSVDLGKYVLDNGAEAELVQAARALVYRQSGRWVRALLVLARINKYADSLLDFNVDSMTERDRRMVEEFRLRELNGGEERDVGVPRSRGRLSGARDERQIDGVHQ